MKIKKGKNNFKLNFDVNSKAILPESLKSNKYKSKKKLDKIDPNSLKNSDMVKHPKIQNLLGDQIQEERSDLQVGSISPSGSNNGIVFGKPNPLEEIKKENRKYKTNRTEKNPFH